MLAIFISALTFLATTALVVGISEAIASGRGSLQQRISQIAAEQSARTAPRASGHRELFPTIARFIQERGFGEKLRLELIRAAIPIRPSEFLVLTGLAVLLPMSISLVLGLHWVVTIVLGMIGWLAPKIYLRARQSQRMAQIEAQLADALSLISASLRSGYSFLRASQLVADEMPNPIAEEFGRTVRQTNFGISTEDALKRLLMRVPSYDMDLVVTAVLIQMQVGGNLAEVLENISDTIRERAAIKGEIKVLTAEGRISMVLMAVMPFIMVGVISMINPGYISQLLETTAGLTMITVAGVLQLLGILILRRMVELDV